MCEGLQRKESRALIISLYGEAAVDGKLVHHKDGNPYNNDLGNLEIVSRAEHAKRHSALGSWNGWKKSFIYRLNKEKIEKAMSEQFLTHAELARKLKWSRSLLAWALTKGSKSFAPKIAKVLGLDVSEIIVVQPNKKGPAGAGNPARRG